MIDLPEEFKKYNPSIEEVYYQDGFKYQTTRACAGRTIVTGYDIETDYCILKPNGWLLIKRKWGCDGASGPTIDTKSTIRPSFEHDIFYRLMREKFLPRSEQGRVDRQLKLAMIKDGAWKVRANFWQDMLTRFGYKNTDPKNRKKELKAP